jgi:putrescine transport system substrate-binding protein
MLTVMPAKKALGVLLITFVLLVSGCSGSNSQQPAQVSTATKSLASGTAGSPDKVLNIYNWADYMDSSVIPAFEKEYGIKVNYDVFNSNEVLETKLLTGHSNYDLVVPSAYFLGRQIKAGVYQKLDKSWLPNLRNVDAEVARDLAVYDPGNQYAVDYVWLVTTGLGYNVGKIRARMADAPVHSWRLIYDPAVVSKFQDCGVSVLDSPVNVISTTLVFLGKDPNSESVEDLNAAEQVLKTIRPYVRYVDSTRYIEDLANGETCLALGWSMDVTRSRDRAKEASNGQSIVFSIPSEGSMTALDVFAIPIDAPHPRNAHLFLNYMLRPEVAAKNSMGLNIANSIPGSAPMLSESLRNDPGVYPPPEVRAKLVLETVKSQEYMRRLTRAWTRFKTGT